jgi:hypothetical protein
MHCASAAESHATTIFGTGHVENIAQIPQQRHFGIAVELAGGPIHFELNHLRSPGVALAERQFIGYNEWREAGRLLKQHGIAASTRE